MACRLPRFRPAMLRTASTRRPATSPWATHDTTGRPRHATVPGVAQLGPAAVAPATIVRRCLVLLALALVAAAPPATAVASPPCPGIRFLVAPALVPRTQLPFDAIVIDADGMTTITNGCPPVPAHVRRRGGRSTLRARWHACGALRSVRMRAIVDDASCASLIGTFSARTTKRRRFQAPRSTCGDGRLDAGGGEQCETLADCAEGQACGACVCGSGSSTVSAAGRKKTTTTSTSTTSTSLSTS